MAAQGLPLSSKCMNHKCAQRISYIFPATEVKDSVPMSIWESLFSELFAALLPKGTSVVRLMTIIGGLCAEYLWSPPRVRRSCGFLNGGSGKFEAEFVGKQTLRLLSFRKWFLSDCFCTNTDLFWPRLFGMEFLKVCQNLLVAHFSKKKRNKEKGTIKVANHFGTNKTG